MQKIKQFVESEKGINILIISIIVFVGVASFELGRLSKEGSSNGIKIEYTDPGGHNVVANVLSATDVPNNFQAKGATATTTGTNPSDKNFFASSRGKKYYTLGCSAGKNIKQENRVYFATALAAESAGYTLSSMCK